MNKLLPCWRYLYMKCFQSKYMKLTTNELIKQYCNVAYNNNLETHLNVLAEYKFHKPTMEQILSSDPMWAHISLTELKNAVEVLLSYNFKINDVTDVLKSDPDICSIEKSSLINTLEAWLSCHFNMNNLIDVLATKPILLKLEAATILARIPTYLLLCNNNRKKCLDFLLLCPEIMFENFEDIIERYDYMKDKMEAKLKDLVSSRAITYDIQFIRTRHTFLDRAGLYEYKTKKINEFQSLNNPTLTSILETPDKIFAEKIGRMGLLEYETFKEYFHQEMDDESENDSVDDDDDETNI